MINTHRTSSRFRQFGASAALAAAAAAIVSAAGAPMAGADTIDDLLMQSEGDFAQAATLYAGVDPSLLPAHEAANQAGAVSAYEDQATMISTLQAHQDALPETLQTSSQFISADQQLATASNDLLTALTNFSNAADAGDYVTGQAATLSGEVTGYFARLDLLYTDLFQVLPAELNAEFTTEFATYPNLIDPTSPVVADLTLPGAAATSTPDEVIGQTITVLNQGTAVLDTAPTADLGARSADLLPAQETLITQFDAALPITESMQDQLSPPGQTFVSGVDEQLVSAAQNILTADQAFAAADQAGELSGSGANLADLAVFGADLQLFGGIFDVIGADALAQVAGHLGVNSAADLATGLGSAAAIDPTLFADLFTSIGL